MYWDDQLKAYIDEGDLASRVGPAYAEAPPATLTPDMLGTTRTWTLNANYTLPALPAPTADAGGPLTLIFKQPPAGGPYTLNLASVPEWVGDALAPTMPTTANSELMVQIIWTGLAWRGVSVGVFFP